MLLEQNDEWQLQHRYMTLETIAGLAGEEITGEPQMLANKAADGHLPIYTTLTDVTPS